VFGVGAYANLGFNLSFTEDDPRIPAWGNARIYLDLVKSSVLTWSMGTGLDVFASALGVPQSGDVQLYLGASIAQRFQFRTGDRQSLEILIGGASPSPAAVGASTLWSFPLFADLSWRRKLSSKTSFKLVPRNYALITTGSLSTNGNFLRSQVLASLGAGLEWSL
jgi:hypothetical protein